MKEYFCEVYRDPIRLKLSIIVGFIENQTIYILNGNEFKKYEEGLEIAEPTLQFNQILIAKEPELLRVLVDGLIKYGITPSKPITNQEELTAVKYHLEDMRRIIFNPKKNNSLLTEKLKGVK